MPSRGEEKTEPHPCAKALRLAAGGALRLPPTRLPEHRLTPPCLRRLLLPCLAMGTPRAAAVTATAVEVMYRRRPPLCRRYPAPPPCSTGGSKSSDTGAPCTAGPPEPPICTGANSSHRQPPSAPGRAPAAAAAAATTAPAHWARTTAGASRHSPGSDGLGSGLITRRGQWRPGGWQRGRRGRNGGRGLQWAARQSFCREKSVSIL